MYRQGAVGALLDIYEQAISNFKIVIEDIPDNVLTIITDPLTTDEDCKSIQAIISHVVGAGYGYAVMIQNLKGNNVKRPDKTFYLTIKEYSDELTNMFAFTEKVLNEFKEIELDKSEKIKTTWGQVFDIDQMCEHAIVHVLRHKRQIEKIKTESKFVDIFSAGVSKLKK